MRREQVFLPLIIALVAAIGMIFGYKMHDETNSADLIEHYAEDDLSSVEESLRLIRANYYGELDTSNYVNDILLNAVKRLDSYSSYVPPQDLTDFHHAISNNYVGYGFDYVTYRDSVVVTDVIENSPADLANINRGDIIFGLEGEQFSDPSEIIYRLHRSDSASVSIYRPTEGINEIISIVKGSVISPALQAKILHQGQIGYLKINRFTDGIFLEFMEQFDFYKSHGLEFKKVIIDLRDNPGGLLDETVKILNQIIQEPNQLIVSTTNNKGKQKDYKSNGRSFLNIQEVVVLINENSASASEIMAGSLQDLGIATIIGANSYGKGKIQQHFSVDNGGALNLTIGEFLLPSGRRIISDTTDSVIRGIAPDIAVASGCEEHKDRRMLDPYRYLIKKGKISAELMTSSQISQLLSDYVSIDENLSSSCEKEKIRRLASLLWHEYQSELDLNEDLIRFDEALSQAIATLSD